MLLMHNQPYIKASLFGLFCCTLFLSQGCNQKEACTDIEISSQNTIGYKIKVTPVNGFRNDDTSSILRVFPVHQKSDSLFVVKTLSANSYYTKDLSEFWNSKNERIKTIADSSDLFWYKNAVLQFNVETNQLKSLSGSLLYTISSLRNNQQYFSTLPYSRQLIEFNGKISFLYQYCLYKSSNQNLYDSSMFLIVTGPDSVYKFGSYLPAMKNKLLIDKEIYFAVDHDNNIVYVHSGVDTVYKINTKGVVLSKSILKPEIKRGEVNKSKLTDLAWKRKYAARNLKNCKLAILRNGHIVLLRKLPGDSIIGKKRYQLLIFDDNLKQIYNGESLEEVYPLIVLSHKGFYLLSSNGTVLYEYYI